MHGAPADYDHWAYLGNPGWSWADVLPTFRRIEDFDGGASEWHGTGGILHLHSSYEPDPIHQAIIEAAVETGIPHNPDYNGATQDGISQCQFSIIGGKRNSTAVAYLGAILDHPNLTLLPMATARRLILEDGRCVGVEWERDGRLERAHAEQEVVVAGGTIGSPALLLASGIGPADELHALGIDVAVDLPGVGRNLHDHLLSPIIYSAEREIGPPSPGLPACQTHLFTRNGPGRVAPDLQPIHFMVPMYEPWMEGPPNGFTMLAGMIRPVSRGTLRLAGPNPEDGLLLDPATLACEADVDTLEAAVELVREYGAARALADWGARELYPGPEVRSRAEVRDYVRRTAITYHHQVGTCKMGVDAEAVVSPRLNVHGVDGLRVADASIMPAVTSGNTNAPSILIGEKAAEFVIADLEAASRVAAQPTAAA